MIRIALALLSGWILSWFGFDHTVISGVHEVFGRTITETGYYFLFGFVGALILIFKPIINFGNKNKKEDKNESSRYTI